MVIAEKNYCNSSNGAALHGTRTRHWNGHICMHEQSLAHLLEVTQSLALKTPDSFQNHLENVSVVCLGKVVSGSDSRPVSVYNREELIPHEEIGIDGNNNSQSFQQMPKLHLEWLT